MIIQLKKLHPQLTFVLTNGRSFFYTKRIPPFPYRIKILVEGGMKLDNLFKDKLAYYDPPNHRVIIHYYFQDKKVLRIIFNFIEVVEDHVDGCLRDYMPLSAKEEVDFLKERKKAAWKRLCKIPIY